MKVRNPCQPRKAVRLHVELFTTLNLQQRSLLMKLYPFLHPLKAFLMTNPHTPHMRVFVLTNHTRLNHLSFFSPSLGLRAISKTCRICRRSAAGPPALSR